MAFIIGLLTLVMVLDCLLLILLVLIQLPKKEAGAGLAFGGGATDALFGSGSGTVLTKITKYAAAAFFVMALGLSLLQSNYHRRAANQFTKQIEQAGAAQLPLPPVAASQTSRGTNPSTVATSTNTSATIAVESTNTPKISLPASPSTNPPAATPGAQK